MKTVSLCVLTYLIFLSPLLGLCQHKGREVCLNDLLEKYYSTFDCAHFVGKGEYYFIQEKYSSFYCDTTKKSCFFNLHYYLTNNNFLSYIRRKFGKKDRVILLQPVIHFCSTDSLNVKVSLCSGTYKQYKPLSLRRKKHTLFVGSAGNMYFDLKYNLDKECWDIIKFDIN